MQKFDAIVSECATSIQLLQILHGPCYASKPKIGLPKKFISDYTVCAIPFRLQFVAIPLLGRPDYSALYDLYTQPATKCGPFLVGLLLGVFTLRPPPSAPSSPSSASSASSLLFWIGFLLALGTIYGILPEYWHPDQGVTLYNTLYTATFRTLFSGAIALMLVSRFLAPPKSR